jgi:hypothetical protein
MSALRRTLSSIRTLPQRMAPTSNRSKALAAAAACDPRKRDATMSAAAAIWRRAQSVRVAEQKGRDGSQTDDSADDAMQAAADHLSNIPLKSKTEYKALIAEYAANRS